jgi:hypothetical protein
MARVVGHLALNWRGHVIRPTRIVPVLADLLRGVAMVFDACAAVTTDATWARAAGVVDNAADVLRDRVQASERELAQFAAPPATIPPRKRELARATLAQRISDELRSELARLAEARRRAAKASAESNRARRSRKP